MKFDSRAESGNAAACKSLFREFFIIECSSFLPVKTWRLDAGGPENRGSRHPRSVAPKSTERLRVEALPPSKNMPAGRRTRRTSGPQKRFKMILPRDESPKTALPHYLARIGSVRLQSANLSRFSRDMGVSRGDVTRTIAWLATYGQAVFDGDDLCFIAAAEVRR